MAHAPARLSVSPFKLFLDAFFIFSDSFIEFLFSVSPFVCSIRCHEDMRDKYPEQSFALDRFRDIRESCSLPPMFFFDESPYHLVVVGMSFSCFEKRKPRAGGRIFDDRGDIAPAWGLRFSNQ